MQNKIVYIKREEIDNAKWDHLIDNAINSLIYAKTYYIDHITQSWGAVILGDYQAAMPLIFRKKMGIAYVYMPPFIQQLGIFYKEQPNAEVMETMLSEARKIFKFGEYNLNHNNQNNHFLIRANYLLNLHPTYDVIKKNYKLDLKKNLKKAASNNLNYTTNGNVKKAIDLYKDLYKKRLSLSSDVYKKFLGLCIFLQNKNEAIVRQVVDATGTTRSIAICLKYNQRLYFILSATTPAGRSLKANHYLIDRLIHEFSGQNLLFDFEGSDIEGIAHFYQNFGTFNQPYYFFRWNNLPWPISLVKG